MTILTREQVAEIEARAEKATKAPWRVEHDSRPTIYSVGGQPTPAEEIDVFCRRGYGGYYNDGHIGSFRVFDHAKYELANEDALFIAASRTDIPALVATVRELRLALIEARHCRDCAPGGCKMCAVTKRIEDVLK